MPIAHRPALKQTQPKTSEPGGVRYVAYRTGKSSLFSTNSASSTTSGKLDGLENENCQQWTQEVIAGSEFSKKKATSLNQRRPKAMPAKAT